MLQSRLCWLDSTGPNRWPRWRCSMTRSRAGDVLPYLNQRSREGADTFRAVNEGSHGASCSVLDLVRDARNLAQWMQNLP